MILNKKHCKIRDWLLVLFGHQAYMATLFASFLQLRETAMYEKLKCFEVNVVEMARMQTLAFLAADALLNF